MANTVTITSTTGPGVTDTALVLTDVVDLRFNFAARTVYVKRESGPGQYFSFNSITTVTFTISGVSSTITLS